MTPLSGKTRAELVKLVTELGNLKEELRSSKQASVQQGRVFESHALDAQWHALVGMNKGAQFACVVDNQGTSAGTALSASRPSCL